MTKQTSTSRAGSRFWRPSADVSWSTHGDLVILLSFTTGRYSTLDECGARIWYHLCEAGLSTDDVAKEILIETGSTELLTTLQDDVEAFINDLYLRSLIEPSEAKPSATQSKTFDWKSMALAKLIPFLASRCSIPSCLVALAITRRLLRTVGLNGTLEILGKHLRAFARQELPESALNEVTDRLRKAATLYPLSTACLDQSVCLLWLLRKQGADVKLRLGVAPYPFDAHAWVEHLGQPVNETRESVAIYRPMTDTPVV